MGTTPLAASLHTVSDTGGENQLVEVDTDGHDLAFLTKIEKT